MELREGLLELLSPLCIGETLDGAELRGASTELGLRLTFEIDGTRVHVEVFPADIERPHAARSKQLYFAYRAGAITGARGQALCHAVADRARENEARVLAALVVPASRARVREVSGGSLLELAGTRERPWLSLSPYVGCLIGCRFCYAQERVGIARRMRGIEAAPWGSYVDARTDAADVLERELATAPPYPVKLCPIVSDPYHAVEEKLRLTRACLEVLRDEAQHGDDARLVLVLTRSELVKRDLDLFETMRGASVGFSLPTLDDGIRAWFEPRSAPIQTRLDILGQLRARGVTTFAVVQPMLPGDPERLADALAEVADSVSLDVLRGEESAGPLFDAHDAVRSDVWQRERQSHLERALDERGVPRWVDDLPPDDRPLNSHSAR